MRLKKIVLKNGYKRFHHLTIDLGSDPKRIIALVGSNGCGKSSFINGLLYLNNLYAPLGNTDGKNYMYHSLLQDPNFSPSNVEIEFTDGDFYDIRRKKQELGKVNTIFSFRSSFRHDANLKVNNVQSMTDISRNEYGASNVSDIDAKVMENYRRLLIMFDNYTKIHDCKPSATKSKILGELNYSLQKCLDLQISSPGDVGSGRGTLYFTKSDQSLEFEFDVLSAGEKQVVDILLDLYVRQDEFDDTIFIIDEPELHLNASIQKNLLFEINRLVGKNCQILIATHSIGLLSALKGDLKDESQVIYFPNDVSWATTTKELKPIKYSFATWREIFKTALDDLSELVSPKRLIYCEGKAKPSSKGDEIGFDAKVYNNIFGDAYTDTLFTSGGGNCEIKNVSSITISILTKVIRELEILTFRDLDEINREDYLKVNPNHCRIMKRREIENYLYDKEVLTRYCKEAGKEFNETGYDILVKDILFEKVKNLGGKIKKICGITHSISLKDFNLNLSNCITEEMKVYKELEQCIFYREYGFI